ncbi:hypothetical protein Pmani_014877 [Petrolisthes manimaculis]|uniref:Uncharacterized protein n=1 Tax=Petrolisthes manimaculis TaxID=1843537 RepID=A0AAE1U890_9EUCA|nr:hypothetical protein Pmani_014877 [Petrolisthes manimaculis]
MTASVYLLLMGSLMVMVLVQEPVWADTAIQVPSDAKSRCLEGSSWSQDCNTCRCINGLAACTKRLCPDLPPQCYLPSVSLTGNIHCTAHFKMWSFSAVRGECYEFIYGGCGGTDNLYGTRAACEATCLNQSPPQEECVPGTSWSNGCNSCFCSEGRAVCTLRACLTDGEAPSDPFAGLPPGAECVPGSRFYENCNWCTCMKGGRPRCTLRGCHGPAREVTECEGDAVWRKDCNLCHCREGVSVCTKKACYVKVRK